MEQNQNRRRVHQFLESLATAMHTTGKPETWIDQSGFSRQEKLYCFYVKYMLTGKPLKSVYFSHWRRHLRGRLCKMFKQATGTMILLVYVGSIVI